MFLVEIYISLMLLLFNYCNEVESLERTHMLLECNACKEDNVICGECEDKETWFDYCGCAHHTCKSRGVCRHDGMDKLVSYWVFA